MLDKRGFKYMLNDLEDAKKNLSKFKRGLSVFEDQTLCDQLLNSSNAPGISSEYLRDKLADVLLSQQVAGPQTSIKENLETK